MSIVQAHPNPGALVREYLARNDSLGFSAGGGQENDAWLDHAAECPGHLGGTDGIGVVARYAVDSLGGTSDSVSFLVHYDGLGGVGPDGRFDPRPFTRDESILVVRTPYGWRLAGQVGDPLMSARAVERQLSLPPTDRQILDSLVRTAASASRPGA